MTTRNLTTKTTHDLEPGDLVVTHGMRVRLPEDPEAFHRYDHHGSAPDAYGPVVSVRGLVENVDEVLEAGTVPESWLLEGEWVDGVGWVMVRPHRWTIQGNRLARWAVEVPAR